MPSVTLASRAFASDDQVIFAGLTGDFNPIHLDPVAARRTQAATVIVHGVHTILWALDKIVQVGAVTEEIVSLNVQFKNFIPVGKQVELKLLSRDAKSTRLEPCLGSLTTTIIEVPDAPPRTKLTDKPANFVRIEEMAKLSGWMGSGSTQRDPGPLSVCFLSDWELPTRCHRLAIHIGWHDLSRPALLVWRVRG